jgi:hypothetical protein
MVQTIGLFAHGGWNCGNGFLAGWYESLLWVVRGKKGMAICRVTVEYAIELKRNPARTLFPEPPLTRTPRLAI